MYLCEIVKDFDGTYYANMTAVNGEQCEFVTGLPEYVSWDTLKRAIRENTGAVLPPLKEIAFSRLGRKQYATVTM